jgi:hypothetical protein
MKKLLVVSALLGGLLLAPGSAQAHCDALDGPVATVATKALETGNVNAVLPFAPAAAESEIRDVFAQVRSVRGTNAETRKLADRYFLETVVRLHRQGENAPYTGLKPAGTDFGPIIPAAEEALETGDSKQLVALLTEGVRRHVEERFRNTLKAQSLPRPPQNHADVAAARERVHAELGFVVYAEGLHQALIGQGSHAEGGHKD